MKARRKDLITRAILAQAKTIRRALRRWGFGEDDADDIEQMVIWKTYDAAKHDRVGWKDADRLRAYLRVVTNRTVWAWWRARRGLVELQDEDEPTEPPSEHAVMAESVIRMLRESTTPERWRAIRWYAMGHKVKDIAARERVPVPTIYTRIRLGRRDFAAVVARESAAAIGPIVRRK